MRIASVAVIALASMLAACGAQGSGPTDTGSVEADLEGNIANAIEIDGDPDGADLYDNLGVPLNAASVDWVADATAENSGVGCLGADPAYPSVATCIEPGVTGAVGGVGTWRGVRIVDGIAGDDQDIFVQGGKENDVSTWTIDAGSVGSSKYDIVQAYLANNHESLFFGMERRGNNGTTFFDFEFNQRDPEECSGIVDDLPDYVPCRTAGDVLFGFEMDGSGKSGSATVHFFQWDDVAMEYAPFDPDPEDEVHASINRTNDTPGGPWGHVDQHGNWVLGNFSRHQFAEAMAPLDLLPGVDACGGRAWVQVRTRSSDTDTSDLKDTTPIFQFDFPSVSAAPTLTPSCDQEFGYSVVVTGSDGEAVANPNCSWEFFAASDTDRTTVLATSSDCSGTVQGLPAGSYVGVVTASDPNAAECEAMGDSAPVAVYTPLGASATMTAACDSSFEFVGSGNGGSGSYSYSWVFSSGSDPGTSSSDSGTVTVSPAGQEYTGSLTVTDNRTDIAGCTANAGDAATPYSSIIVTISPSAEEAMCPGLGSDAIVYTPTVSGGDGVYSFDWGTSACLEGQFAATCTIDPSDSAFCAGQDVQVVVDDTASICDPQPSEVETYAKVTIITSTDN